MPSTACTQRSPSRPPSLSHAAYTWSKELAYRAQSHPLRCCPAAAFVNAYVRAAIACALIACIGQLLGTSPRPYRYSCGEIVSTARMSHAAAHEYSASSIDPRLYVWNASGIFTRAFGYETNSAALGPPTVATTAPEASETSNCWLTSRTIHVSPLGMVPTASPVFGSPSSRSTGPACASSRNFDVALGETDAQVLRRSVRPRDPRLRVVVREDLVGVPPLLRQPVRAPLGHAEPVAEARTEERERVGGQSGGGGARGTRPT